MVENVRTAGGPGEPGGKAASTRADEDRNHEGSAGDGPPPRYGFWAPELAEERAGLLKGVFGLSAILMILVWGILAIYWGSNWKSNVLLPNLHAYIINRDGDGTIGQTAENALFGSMRSGTKMHLNWESVDPAQYPDQQSIDQLVAVQQKCWLAVEIASNATEKFTTARANGDASWNPASIVRIFYSEARANTVVPGLILSPVQRLLSQAYAEMASQVAAQYLAQIATNTTAVNALARAPQTVASPVVVTPVNLRAWDIPVATAPTFVGLIYVVILALNVTLGTLSMRQAIAPRLKLSSLIAIRFVIPIIVYLWLSFHYSMLNLPFRVHFNGWGLGFGPGFLTFVAATWCGMIVLGFTVECVVTLVGPQFIGFFLILWIIANVSTVAVPLELAPSFFKYGYAMPFFHLRQIYLIVIFNTSRKILLLYHFGILWAWMAFLFLTFPIWIRLERKRADKAAKEAQIKQNQQDQESSQQEGKQQDA